MNYERLTHERGRGCPFGLGEAYGSRAEGMVEAIHQRLANMNPAPAAAANPGGRGPISVELGLPDPAGSGLTRNAARPRVPLCEVHGNGPTQDLPAPGRAAVLVLARNDRAARTATVSIEEEWR